MNRVHFIIAGTIFCSLIVRQSLSAEELTNPPPTFANVSYGPDARNVLDFWQAEGDGPHPLLIMIHGGGWTAGDKDQYPNQSRTYQPDNPEAAYVMPYLKKGISCAAINYRFAPQHPLPTPVRDAARALQFLRSKADEWKIQPDRIAATGVSAGAATSMWLLYHDDLADPDADDPVLRESTRLTAAVSFIGQTSIDPHVLKEWLGPKVLEHRMPYMAVGENSLADAMKNYDQHRPLFTEYSACNHVSSDDPPLMMVYDKGVSLPARNASHGIHHPMQGIRLKEKTDAAGIECHLLIPDTISSAQYETPFDFLVSKLLKN